MRSLDWAIMRLNNLFVITAGTAVILLMTLATVNVFLRIFGIPYRGTYEIVSFLGAIVIAFALGETQRIKANIVVDIVSDRYPQWLKKVVDIIGYIVSMSFFLIVGRVIFRWGMQISTSGELSETLKIAYHPLIYLVSLGFLFLSLTLFLDLLKTIVKKEGRKTS
jgi:TRAP-type C4-dicarboxylate transport system permease small subunit